MKRTPACEMEGIVEMFSEKKEASLVMDAILDVLLFDLQQIMLTMMLIP